MSHNKTNLKDGSHNDNEESTILIEDLVRYLSRLSTLTKDPLLGNIDLSKGLKKLSNALKPHSKMPILDIGNLVINEIATAQLKGATQRHKVELPESLDSISNEDVDKILNENKFTKDQLVELGNRRFGIPKSKLMHLTKKFVIESIQAAFDHEKSLGVISQEARRGGEERSS